MKKYFPALKYIRISVKRASTYRVRVFSRGTIRTHRLSKHIEESYIWDFSNLEEEEVYKCSCGLWVVDNYDLLESGDTAMSSYLVHLQFMRGCYHITGGDLVKMLSWQDLTM